MRRTSVESSFYSLFPKSDKLPKMSPKRELSLFLTPRALSGASLLADDLAPGSLRRYADCVTPVAPQCNKNITGHASRPECCQYYRMLVLVYLLFPSLVP